MDKANVMKALALCGSESETCIGCPYDDMEDCKSHMCNDARALLKANDKPKYRQAYIFTKRTDLLSYAEGKYDHAISAMAYQAYRAEREVQLILLVRYEENRPVCRIRCPINPLPIKGEFTAISTGAMMSLFNTLGWSFKEKHNLNMFE